MYENSGGPRPPVADAQAYMLLSYVKKVARTGWCWSFQREWQRGKIKNHCSKL